MTSKIFTAPKRTASTHEDLSNELITVLEDRYLPAASFVTAASWGIGEYVAKTTGLPMPKIVLNVFPWTDRKSISEPPPRALNSALSLYWYSQVVSLDRGLQDAIRAMGSVQETLTLAIRGAASAEYESRAISVGAGLRRRGTDHVPADRPST